MDTNIEPLRVAVEQAHGGKAKFLEKVPVLENFQGKPVWEGLVHVFTLEGHPKAKKCYAWSSPVEGSTKRRFYAVLHIPPINSPTDAVRAAIVEEHRRKKGP